MPAFRVESPSFEQLHTEEHARADAAGLASLGDIRCVAVVDLYSAENPKIVAWLHDSGNGPVNTADIPFADLRVSFQGFIHSLQAGE